MEAVAYDADGNVIEDTQGLLQQRLHSMQEVRAMYSLRHSTDSDRNSKSLLEVLRYLRYQSMNSSVKAMMLLLLRPY